MKTLINNIKRHLEAADWSCEYLHPEKWNGTDMDNCLGILGTSSFPFVTISELVDDNLDDILTEWLEGDGEDEFAFVAARHIADLIAIRILSKRKTAVFPSSATFSIIP